MVDPSQPRVGATRWLRAAVPCVLLALIVVVEHYAPLLSIWLIAAGLLAILALGWRVVVPLPPAATAPSHWSTAAGVAGLGLGVFFRLRYLTTVPAGWGSESLAFLRFARHLVDGGFPYEPYSWYAHTLYSYVIAVVMCVVPSDIMAFRIASAAISIATLGVLFLTVRLLFGARPAAIATALLASSHWHLFASRNGYHQQLLPLLQGLFLYGIAAGVLRKRYHGFMIAAAAMVAGLHAHWGYYLMPVYWVAVCAYLVVFQRSLWRSAARSMAAAAIVAIIWLTPLGLFFFLNSQTFNYVLNGFTLSASQAGDLGAKLLGNLRYVAWALSGSPAAPVEFGSRADSLVASASMLGALVALRRSIKTPAYAFVLLLLAVNIAGLTVTLANVFYITATMFAVYALAAVGIEALFGAVEHHTRALLPAFTAVVLLLLAGHAWRNYDEFFAKRIFSELREAQHPPGSAFLILDSIRDSIDERAVFVASGEPGRDFDTAWKDLALEVPSFAFVRRIEAYDTATVLFPPALLRPGKGLDIWLPNVPAVTAVQIPLLRQFYPSLSANTVASPEPYAARGSGAVAYRIRVTAEDLSPYQGLRNGAGFFVAPVNGRYYFRAQATAGGVWIHGEALTLAPEVAAGDAGIFLEAGLQPLRAVGEVAAIEWQTGNKEWRRLDEFLVNAGERPTTELAPFIARPGRAAAFHYQQRLMLRPPGIVRAVEIAADGRFVTAALDALRWHAADGLVEKELPINEGRPLLLAQTPLGLLRVDEDGVWWRVEADGFKRGGTVPCQAAEILTLGADAAVLCRDGQLIRMGLSRPTDRVTLASLLSVADATTVPEEIVVADGQSGRLLRFTAAGELRDWRALAGLYYESEVAGDEHGNLHVKTWRHGIKTYSAGGDLLFSPNTDRPGLFLRAPGLESDSTSLYRLRLRGDKAIALGMHGFIVTFDRVAD